MALPDHVGEPFPGVAYSVMILAWTLEHRGNGRLVFNHGSN